MIKITDRLSITKEAIELIEQCEEWEGSEKLCLSMKVIDGKAQMFCFPVEAMKG